MATANSRRGQALVTTVLSLSLLLVPLLSLLLYLGLELGGRILLEYESFRLARAHLYGNRLSECRPSPLWPSLPRLRVEHRCPEAALVRSKLFLGDQLLGQAKIDLRSKGFLR